MKDKNIFLIILVCTLSLSLALAIFAFQMRGTGRFHGTVEDEEGNFLEGVKIVVQGLEAKKLIFETESIETGRWFVTGIIKGSYSITASKSGYESAYYEMNLSQFTSKNPKLEIKMRKIKESDLPSIMDEESVVLFKEGNELFEQGKYAEAVVKLEEFLEKNFTIYQVNLNIGNCYREMGEHEKAIAAYNKVLERVKAQKDSIEGDEDTAKAMANIGEIHLNQGNMEKAMEYFKQAVDNFPENETIAFNVGEIFFTQGEIDKAIEYFNLAINIKESWATPYRQLGYAYLNKGEYNLALLSLKKFLELAPDSPEAVNIQNLIPTLEELINE